MDRDLVDRFLLAYNRLDDLVRERSGFDRSRSFMSCVTELKKRGDRIAGRCDNELRRYAEVRNLIVHSASPEPVATPSPAAVTRLEAILQAMASPPTLVSIGAAPGAPSAVTTCRLDDTIGRISSNMCTRLLSQLPVVENGRIHGVLTTGTIARWLGSEFTANAHDSEIVVGNVRVGDVLPHAEDPDNFVLLSPNAEVARCLDAFERRSAQGRTLDAVIVTQDGTETKPPQKIFTSFDIPRLMEALTI